jgi:hypothetical protein
MDFMKATRVHLNQFFVLNLKIQQYQLEWSKQDENPEGHPRVFLRKLNKDLS